MWKSIQCAVQGVGHLKENIPCQDQVYFMHKNNAYVISLADGAGSAKLSHIGASVVTQYICNDFAENFDGYYNEQNGVLVKKQLLSNIIEVLRQLSQKEECDIKDLASTLLVVAVKENRFIICHIGDGVIGYQKNDILKVASYPENGEFVNVTVFTTSKDAIYTIKVIKGMLNQINGFVLMSDGTENSLYDKKEKVLAPAIKRIMNLCTIFPESVLQEQLLDSFENIIKRNTSDDCSIIFLVKSYDNTYFSLPIYKKSEILGLSVTCRNRNKRIIKCDKILQYLEHEHNVNEVAKFLYLKPLYAKKYLKELCAKRMIEEKNGKYHSLIT